MSPQGVTNHFSRAIIPDTKVLDDDSFVEMLNNIRASTEGALDAVMSCSPDHVIMGMSAETFWDGKDGSEKLKQKLEERAGISVTLGSDACMAALQAYGNIRRIAVVTPYMPVGDKNVKQFFADCDIDVIRLLGLKCASPQIIAHISKTELKNALIELDGSDIDAIVQVGTNLAMAELAAIAEFWLEKPVIAINTATYWHALRQNQINDKIYGFGRLLAEY